MRITAAIAAAWLSLAGLSIAAEAQAAIRKPTNIPAQPLGQALQTLAKARGFQVIYVSDEVNSRTTHGAAGELTTEEALTQLLEGTGLTYLHAGDSGVTIVPVSSSPAAGAPETPASRPTDVESNNGNPKAGASFWDRFRLAQVDQGQIPATGSVAPRAPNEPVVEEVVVTAQKRPERLQDTPVSVAVISSVALSDNHISGIGQIQQISPSVSFSDSANTRGDGLSIRGIGTLSFSDGVEPSVSTVVDGVVIGRSAATLFDFNDIDRIEILRGPQGTLFGKNSSAGAVNIVTARPDLHQLEADGSVSYGQLNEVKVKESVSVPVVQDTLALRVSSYYDRVDGLVHNLYNGNDLNGGDSYGVRAKLLFRPSDVFDAYLIADYSKSDGECCVSTAISILPTTQYYGPTGPYRTALLAGVVPGSYNLNTRFNGRTFDDQDAFGTSLEMNAHLAGGHTLTSISAYRQFHDLDNNDTDNVPIDLLSLNNANQYQHQFSEEIRIASAADQLIEYVSGAYFFDQNVVTRTDIAGTLGTVLPPGELLGNAVDRAIETKNAAVFGQGTLHLGNHLRLLAGGRQTHEQLDARFLRTVPARYAGFAPGAGGPPLDAPALTASDNNFSYKVGLQYDFTPDVMLYTSYTRGYKGKAINLLNGLSQAIINSGAAVLKPEIPKSYEVGLRTSWLERRLTLNLTGFWTDFKSFQSQSYDPVLLAFTLANAGNLRSRGLEGDASFTPLRGLSFSANVAFTDNDVQDYIVSCYPGQTAAQGCVKGLDNVSGARLVNSPKWAFTLSGNYTHGLGIRDYDGFLNATFTHRSWVNFSFNDPHDIQPGYGVLNLNLGAETGDHRFKLYVFAKNALDKHYAQAIGSTAYDSSATASGYSALLTEDSRRIVGIEFDASL